jgi:hypothetical protein
VLETLHDVEAAAIARGDWSVAGEMLEVIGDINAIAGTGLSLTVYKRALAVAKQRRLPSAGRLEAKESDLATATPRKEVISRH